MKMIARITLMVIALLLLLATIAALSATPAHAESQFKWQHFGTDPYAVSRQEAMRTREDAFRKLGLPQDVVSVLMIATDKPGEKMSLNVGDKLGAMLSKGGVVHRNVTVAFVKPPISGKMEYAAPAEKWQVTFAGGVFTVILPEVCNNWSLISVTLVPLTKISLKSPPVAPPAILTCPDVYILKVNVWESKAMTLSGVERTHAKEELEEKFVYGQHDPQHVSRMHGAQFRKAYAAGDIKRSATSHGFRVSLIMTPEAKGGAPTITAEEVVRDITVMGLRELRFARAELEKWDAIRLVPTEDGGILSPPRYHLTGFHELRFFNHLPGTRLGEWDSNPVPDCLMNEHWIEQID
jgi:hypothetical protein